MKTLNIIKNLDIIQDRAREARYVSYSSNRTRIHYDLLFVNQRIIPEPNILYSCINYESHTIFSNEYLHCHGALFKSNKLYSGKYKPDAIITYLTDQSGFVNGYNRLARKYLNFLMKHSMFKNCFFKRDSVKNTLERGYVLSKTSQTLSETVIAMQYARVISAHPSKVYLWNKLVEAGVDKHMALHFFGFVNVHPNNIDYCSVTTSPDLENFCASAGKDALKALKRKNLLESEESSLRVDFSRRGIAHKERHFTSRFVNMDSNFNVIHITKIKNSIQRKEFVTEGEFTLTTNEGYLLKDFCKEAAKLCKKI